MAEEEVKELPPIEMGPEADFVKKMEDAYAELFKDLAPEVATLDKAQVKSLLDKAIDRGEMTEEDYAPIFDAIPKAEEGADPVAIEEAKEHVIRYAISIGMVPTRLATALEAAAA